MNLKRSDLDALTDIKCYLEEHYPLFITIKNLSHRAGVNSIKLQNGFKQLFERPVYSYLTDIRMRKAAELLSNTEMSIKEISAVTGYRSSSKFIPMFKKYYGLTPLEYRRSLSN
jgi:AraC-like DNA-binding protein